jgi:hypothetical protein
MFAEMDAMTSLEKIDYPYCCLFISFRKFPQDELHFHKLFDRTCLLVPNSFQSNYFYGAINKSKTFCINSQKKIAQIGSVTTGG